MRPPWLGRRAALLLVAVGVLLIGAVAARVARPAPVQPASRYPAMSTCGFERWAVKTLTDPRARLVNFRPRATTVSALRRLGPTGSYTRGAGVERRTYRVRARLVATKLEADQDFHLVIADLRRPNQTMIVEFPASNCTRHALRRKQMAAARAAFVRACGHPSSSSFTYLRGSATITGVGFFDFIHGQTGVAPNGIELHPVLGFTRAHCL
jgi:hypothetical protein